MSSHVVPCGQHAKPEGQDTALGHGQQPQPPPALKPFGEHVIVSGQRVSLQFEYEEATGQRVGHCAATPQSSSDAAGRRSISAFGLSRR